MAIAAQLDMVVQAWREETARRQANNRRLIETDFLPAALEATETPPSPIGRSIIWTIIAAALLALLWACLSKVDVVAVAEGRVVPRARLQSVEAAEAGVIRAIHVREGQRVRAGQLLIDLDPTFADADAGSARTELATAALTRARSGALLAYVAGQPPEFIEPEGADVAAAAAERQLVDARIREYDARRASLLEKRTGAGAAAEMAAQQAAKLRETLPLAEARLAALRELEAKGYAARLRVMEVEERVIAIRRDYQVEMARQNEARAQMAALDRDLAQAEQEFRGEAAKEKAEAESVFATRAETVRKADQRQALQRLVAPVDGVINEISVTTIGEVAEAGKPLVTIVPGGDELIVEALVLNKDAGFVKRGDPVVVKLEAYPFTRHGTIAGKLENISADSIVDERRGLVFPARVTLSKSALRVEGHNAELSPGMVAIAEIVTDQRRVIDFLWSPVARAVAEAGRER
ncbi:HlyD family type I secretion periplasmic adaptor subunit [Sphingobium sp. CFD-2]|jgi:hemolysin D|uniref:HlyD family type I secretion periplasmic adaptor subunit n=1 Tax=Sphingobium sp. CFD-2 TaxID=2878542 RepID=UPI00214CE4A0|nr:HlyD family type I secretion periplasmic adaptor subunit [Sphingobium sp. CFD-2]